MLNCDTTTVTELKKHKLYKTISGRSTMKKSELCKALNKAIRKSSKSKKVVEPKSSSQLTSPKTPKKVASILSSTQALPLELYKKIMLDMNPRDMLSACTTNKKALSLCMDDNFWKDYYSHKNMKFVPSPYDYKKRIIQARLNIMTLMSIEDLEKECMTDDFAAGICSSTTFWSKYHMNHGYPNTDFLGKSAQISTDNRILEYKLREIHKNNSHKTHWLTGKIYPAHFDKIDLRVNEEDNRYKYYAFRDSLEHNNNVMSVNVKSYPNPTVIFRIGKLKYETDMPFLRLAKLYQYFDVKK